MMQGPLLGVYWAPAHGQPEHLDYIAAINGPVRILEPDVQHIADAVTRTSGEIWPRFWRIDDHDGQAIRDMLADPEGSGGRMADALIDAVEELAEQARQRGLPFPDWSRIWLSGINEPPIWDADKRGPFIRHEVAFLDRLTERGKQGLALRGAVGHPAELDDQQRPIWEPYEPIYHAIKRGNHRLELHEYWYWTGPQDGWGWHAGRHHKCPWDVRIVIGEAGIDNYVDETRWNGERHRARGWVGNATPQQMAQHFDYYFDHADWRRVEVVLPFLSDFQNRQWGSFDLLGAYGEISAWWRSQRAQQEAAQPLPAEEEPRRHRTYVPVVRTVVKSGDTPAAPDFPAPSAIPDLPVMLRGMARVLGVDARLPYAFLMAEAGGVVRAPDMIVRFEPHIFRQRVEGWLFDEWFRVGTPEWAGDQHRVKKDGQWVTFHGNQALEYYALDVARKLNARAAYESVAMGAGQIMGFNHALVGYATPQAMWEDYTDPAHGAFNQVCGFFAYCMNRPGMRAAMQGLDYAKMAEIYNGAGQVPLYSSIIRKYMGA